MPAHVSRIPTFAFRFLAAMVVIATPLFSGPATAQFTQQGPKLTGTGAVGNAVQAWSVAVSADGNTLILGGPNDSSSTGAAWVFTRSNGVWTQQGNKLVGSGAIGGGNQGYSVALSADGNTALVGGWLDNSSVGAAWVFTRSGGVWSQQGGKLTGNDSVGPALQGVAVALSADGNTAIFGGRGDNTSMGAAWVFTRSGGVWTQQGPKLVGSGSSATAWQGVSVALSADGNTAIMGGSIDNPNGAAWVFTRSGNTWTQQGPKLVGTGNTGFPEQGASVALSADGNTALVGGFADNSNTGAVWVFTRSAGAWSQQGNKLVGGGATGAAAQGGSVSLSADGNTALIGGANDNSAVGAAWVFTRSGAVWSQAGNKLIGAGGVGTPIQGHSVALSANAATAVIGGSNDATFTGAAWVFVQPKLQVSPATNIAATGNSGGPFSPPSFDYTLSAPGAAVNYVIGGTPDWLTPSTTSGTIAAGGQATVTFTVNANANAKSVGTQGPAAINFVNASSGVGNTAISATLTVGSPGPVSVISAVLPASRSVQVGTAATAFATIINTAGNVGTNCGLGLGSSIPAAFHFQTTDPATNALTGTLNTGVNIPAGGAQSYVFAIAPTSAFAPLEVAIVAGCSNSGPAPSIVGLNTLLLSASTAPVPDIVALAATAGNNGIVDIAGANGVGAFAVATVNVGITADITASVDSGAASLPLAFNLCQTNPASGQCTSAIGTIVTASIPANATPTFAIFVQGSGNVPFDPAHSRIFVRFKDAGGVVRGATSVAVRTQ